jgi:Domain of unknown function (DUF4333)
VPVASRTVPRRARLPIPLVALVVGLAIAGVLPAGAADLPRTAVRREVERSVHTAYPALAFGNVACPDRTRRAQGVKFTCTVQLPGTFLFVDAEQTDGTGTVTLSTQQAVIPTQSLRDLVARNASLPATVDCGPAPFRVARVGETITCHAALADGTARDVDLLVQDTAGNVTVSAVR